MSRDLTVPPLRLARWFDGFIARNGELAEIGVSTTGTTVRTVRGGYAELPGRCVSARTISELVAALLPAGSAVIVLVRRGGYSIARASYAADHHTVLASKTGTRYVQGRTAAGGQSQQRFARRRANQAAALVDSVVDAARAALGDTPAPVRMLVTGGDPQLLREVLAREPLRRLESARTVAVQIGEPRRRTLDEALVAARSVRIVVSNADDR